MKIIVLICGMLMCNYTGWAQSGCTDPNASKPDPSAKVNDGSCTYPNTNYTLPKKTQLASTTLDENSGLVYIDGNLWTFNDSGGGAIIYRIDDQDGSIKQKITLSNAQNIDWEDITADAEHLYIGDFGNNENGNRQNLAIYKIKKSDIPQEGNSSVTAEEIQFSYADQTDFTATGNNNTSFDCEAFFVYKDQLHLFTKDWIGSKTKHYTLPVTPGNHKATFQNLYDVKGLVTGADISPYNTSEAILTGYDKIGNCFMWLLFDFSGTQFFSGNKRRIGLGSAATIGQIEGIAFNGPGLGYISSERFTKTVFGITINVPPTLYTFSTSDWVEQQPLGVDLLEVKASYVHPYVRLTWQTSSESNSDFFSIERSSDGKHYEAIGSLKGAGYSSTIKNYSFIDRSPVGGINYYRIRQVDADGAFLFFPIRGVTVPAQKPVTVYPNPLTRGQQLTTEVEGTPPGFYKVLLKTLAGHTIWSEQLMIEKTVSLPLSLKTQDLTAGMYVVQVISPTSITNHKLIVR